MPEGEAVLARFAEMRPVFQPNNPIGGEAKGQIAPYGGIISMVKDESVMQGIEVTMFARVGLDYGAPNRIGYIAGVGGEAAKKAPSKPAPKADEEA